MWIFGGASPNHKSLEASPASHNFREDSSSYVAKEWIMYFQSLCGFFTLLFFNNLNINKWLLLTNTKCINVSTILAKSFRKYLARNQTYDWVLRNQNSKRYYRNFAFKPDVSWYIEQAFWSEKVMCDTVGDPPEFLSQRNFVRTHFHSISMLARFSLPFSRNFLGKQWRGN